MKNRDFVDEQHANSYLSGTIIRVGGIPIYVDQLSEGGRVEKKWRMNYHIIGDDEVNILFLPNEKIDMNPVPLGMMNFEESVFYVSRIPTRGWKVGLAPSNVSFYPLGPAGNGGGAPPLISKELRKCILGQYPDFTGALKKIRAGKNAIAFSRRFAINGGSLLFKNGDKAVGVAERQGPILFDNFQYLEETLQEDLNA